MGQIIVEGIVTPTCQQILLVKDAETHDIKIALQLAARPDGQVALFPLCFGDLKMFKEEFVMAVFDPDPPLQKEAMKAYDQIMASKAGIQLVDTIPPGSDRINVNFRS